MLKTMVVAALLALSTTTAHSQSLSSLQILNKGQSVWSDTNATGPIHVKVNLHSQMAYVYSGQTVIGMTSVSTGRDGFQTDLGHFTVLGKEENHFSDHYKADMPWTLWFTTTGEALHAGGDPGSRSSHGCVHLPKAFAAKLYGLMKVGDHVDIVDEQSKLALNL